jgi:hypothetical protein
MVGHLAVLLLLSSSVVALLRTAVAFEMLLQ